MQGRLRPPLFRKRMTSKHSLFSSLGRRLGGLFKKESAPDAGPRALSDRGLLAFSHTGDVIRAERLLRQQGFDVDVKGPPPQMRTGCDMVVVFPLPAPAKIKSGPSICFTAFCCSLFRFDKFINLFLNICINCVRRNAGEKISDRL